MKYQALIVDDEELARELIANYLSRLPMMELAGKCKNAPEAFNALHSQAIDVLFLDVQMPGLSGIEMICTLPYKPAIILTTAYSEYALEGYDLDISDYLLKPISFERFSLAVNKAIRFLGSQKQAPPQSPSASVNYILVRADHKLHRLFFEDILYIKSMQEYVAYHTKEGRILALGSLKHLEETLPQTRFIRVHKSYMVPIAKVSTLEGNLIHVGKEKIPVGASYRTHVLEILFPDLKS